MKFYKIYLVSLSYRKLDPLLYAFTDKKKLKERFEKERDMNTFRIIESRDKEEFHYLVHYNNRLMLKDIILETSADDELNRRMPIHVVGTRREEDDLAKSIEDYLNFHVRKFKTPPWIFNKKYYLALDSLMYVKLYQWSRYQNGLPFHEDPEIIYTSDIIGRDYDSPDAIIEKNTDDFRYDEFAIFLEMYGGTMR